MTVIRATLRFLATVAGAGLIAAAPHAAMADTPLAVISPVDKAGADDALVTRIHFFSANSDGEAVATAIEAGLWGNFKVRRPLTFPTSAKEGGILETDLAYANLARLKAEFVAGPISIPRNTLMFQATVTDKRLPEPVIVWCGLQKAMTSPTLLCLQRTSVGTARIFSGSFGGDMKTWIVSSLYPDYDHSDFAQDLSFPEMAPVESKKYNMRVAFLTSRSETGLAVYRHITAPNADRGPEAYPDRPIDKVSAVRYGRYDYYPMGDICLVIETGATRKAVGWVETSAVPAEVLATIPK